MPSVTVTLSAFQIEKAMEYARRNRVRMDDVVARALDLFLAAAEADAAQSPDVTPPGPADPPKTRP